ncbi:uncharacterized protein DS421_2g40140 [Arachis hypogaea]|nr:uncharacterized protein DS421_2g40140 [Arachis hypogaea]
MGEGDRGRRKGREKREIWREEEHRGGSSPPPLWRPVACIAAVHPVVAVRAPARYHCRAMFSAIAATTPSQEKDAQKMEQKRKERWLASDGVAGLELPRLSRHRILLRRRHRPYHATVIHGRSRRERVREERGSRFNSGVKYIYNIIIIWV